MDFKYTTNSTRGGNLRPVHFLGQSYASKASSTISDAIQPAEPDIPPSENTYTIGIRSDNLSYSALPKQLCLIYRRHNIDRRKQRPLSEASDKISRHYEFSSSGIFSPDYKDFHKAPTNIAADTNSTLKVNEYATWRLVTEQAPGTMFPTGRVYESLDVAPLASASSRSDRGDTLRMANNGRTSTPYFPGEMLVWNPAQNRSVSSCKHTM